MYDVTCVSIVFPFDLIFASRFGGVGKSGCGHDAIKRWRQEWKPSIGTGVGNRREKDKITPWHLPLGMEMGRSFHVPRYISFPAHCSSGEVVLSPYINP